MSNHFKFLYILLFSLGLVVLTFPEVIFKEGSFRNLEIMSALSKDTHKIVSVYQERRRGVDYGYADYGGAAMQSEPTHYFLQYCLWNNESPFWNPYIGGGLPGLEGLVDLTFSPLSFLMAITKGGTIGYHIFVLLTFMFGIFFLIKTFHEILGLSFLSSALGSVVYLLNGFHVANLNSNVIQPYLYFPLLIYAAFNFFRHPAVISYIFLVLSLAMALAATFIPTLSLVLGVYFLLSTCYLFSQDYVWKVKRKLFLIFSSAFAFSILLMSFMYLPIIEHLKLSSVLETYSARAFYPSNFEAFISFFSPRHFWESYTGMGEAEQYFGVGIFHFGIIPVMIASQITFKGDKYKALKYGALIVFLVSLMRIFNAPVVSHLVSLIPFYGSVGSQYWWTATSLSFVFLSAFGLEAVVKENIRPHHWRLVGLVIIGWLIYLMREYGLSHKSPLLKYTIYDTERGVLYISLIFLFLYLGPFIIEHCRSAKGARSKKIWLSVLILAVFSEYIFYMNHQRYTRQEQINTPPDYVHFIKMRIGNNRMINYGGEGVMPDLGAALQIQQVESMTMATSSSYYSLIDRKLMSLKDKWTTFIVFFKQDGEEKIDRELLNMLGVKFILVNSYMTKYMDYFQNKMPMVFEHPRFKIFENKEAFNKAFIVHSLLLTDKGLDDIGGQFERVAVTQDKDFFTDAYKQGLAIYNIDSKNQQNEANEEATITEYHHDRIRIRASVATPAVLVLMDTWHANWKAYVDGKEIKVAKVNEAFRGILLSKGDHQIDFKYQPRTLWIGKLITGFMIFLLFLMFMMRGRIQNIFIKNSIKR